MELTQIVKIVLVDDDEKIASLSGQSLETKGFTVKVFSNPLEVLDFLKGNPDYNILISDNIMPEMNGQELIKNVLEINPEQRCILATGDDSSDIGSIKEHSNVVVLAKPFRRKDLIEAISNFYN